MLQVRYFAFDFGERASRIEAAPDQLLAADYSFKAVHQTVLFDTERRYYALLNASGLREAAEVNLRNAEQLKGGGGALSCRAHAHPDALDACPAAAQADYELQAAVRQVDIAQEICWMFSERSPVKALAVQPLEELQLSKVFSEDVSAAVARSLAQRPQLGEQVAEKQAAEAKIKGTRLAFLPTLDFTRTGVEIRAYGQQKQQREPTLRIWDAGLQLRWDVFDGGRRIGELWRPMRGSVVRRPRRNAHGTNRDSGAGRICILRTAFHQRDGAALLLIRSVLTK